MNYLIKLCIAGTFLCLGQANEVNAQKKQQMPIELELATISEKAISFFYQNSDSVLHYSNMYDETLINYINNNPSSFKETFHYLQEQNLLNVVTSEDKKFRIYSWETFDNGSMRFNNVLFQFKVDKEIKTQQLITQDPTDPLYNFTVINTLNNKGKTYYIAQSKTIVSNKELSETIHLFTIEDSVVNADNNLFKTTKNNYNKIDVFYDIFSANESAEIGSLIQYHAKDKIVKIPVVTPEGVITPRYIIYKFDGTNFIHTKIENISTDKK